jgi:hypothetical protein
VSNAFAYFSDCLLCPGRVVGVYASPAFLMLRAVAALCIGVMSRSVCVPWEIAFREVDWASLLVWLLYPGGCFVMGETEENSQHAMGWLGVLWFGFDCRACCAFEALS